MAMMDGDKDREDLGSVQQRRDSGGQRRKEVMERREDALDGIRMRLGPFYGC